MEIALIVVILLLGLSIIGLIVGVSNDAVNFINSAVGSKVAPLKIIMAFAATGLLLGVTFSSGMMDVAKGGIFYPQFFNLTEVLYIFLAVMVTSVLLMDLYNSFGLPTSTTITLVAGLFGSALAISTFKLISHPDQLYQIVTYLNVSNLLRIFVGIMFSVVLAFLSGGIVQFLARFIFTFDYKKRLKRFGGIWVGFAVTILMYFIFLKGIKGISFISHDTIVAIENNQSTIFASTFVVSAIIGQVILTFTKINLLKYIVLLGTFSLALSFAANDLVNFIGAPLAGLTAYQIAQLMENPLSTTLAALATTKVNAETWMLLVAGVIMAFTLIFSKKSRTVTKTEVSLSRQDEGLERFESNAVARGIVRMALTFFDSINKYIPRRVKVVVNKRFNTAKYKPVADENGEYPSYDLLRASVILVVSSALISFGTSLKLPLSTTYVTFIVAMAAAFADRSWGRDSAVYRVSGVVTVIGGWFFTAVMAIIMAFVIAAILFYTNIFGITILSALTVWSFIKTAKFHKKREKEEATKLANFNKPIGNEIELAHTIQQDISEFLNISSNILIDSCNSLIEANLKQLKDLHKESQTLSGKVDPIIKELLITLAYTTDEKIEARDVLSKAITSFVAISDKLVETTKNNKNYIDNNHYLLLDVQIEELQNCCNLLKNITDSMSSQLNVSDFSFIHNLDTNVMELKTAIKKNNKNQLKRIKKNSSAMKRSMLFLNLMKEFDDYTDDMIFILETSKDLNYAINVEI